jgi:hypothetical protein
MHTVVCVLIFMLQGHAGHVSCTSIGRMRACRVTSAVTCVCVCACVRVCVCVWYEEPSHDHKRIFEICTSDTATCKTNGNFLWLSTADLYQFATGTPSELFPVFSQVAVLTMALVTIIITSLHGCTSYIRIYVYVYIYIYIYIYPVECICKCTYMYECMCTVVHYRADTNTYIYIHIYIYIYIYNVK